MDPEDIELIQKYKQCWPLSIAKFCHQYEINRGNFSQWLLGKRISRSSSDAVRKWLASESPLSKPPEEPVYIQSVSLLDASAKIVDSKYTRLVFVDADGFDSVLVGETPFDVNTSFVLCLLRINGKSRHVMKFLNAHPDTSVVVKAKTLNKDAADTLMAMASALLDNWLPIDVEFVFAAEDRFVREIMAQLGTMSTRKCAWLSFKDASNRAQLKGDEKRKRTFKYDADFDTLPALQTLRSAIADGKVILPLQSGDLGRLFPITDKEKLALNANCWLQALNYPGVLTYLGAVLCLSNESTTIYYLDRPTS